MPAQTLFRIEEASQAGEARRLAARLAREAGLDATDAGRAAIVAAELASNLVRHAHGGELLLQIVAPSGSGQEQGRGVEMISIDRGPGMSDPTRCLDDGYSTAGTSGSGLGSVRRQSNEFDLYTTPPEGTIIFSRVYATPARGDAPPASAPVQWGAVCVPAPGESACGDAWRLANRDGRAAVLLVDGLGHGPGAAEAADEACRVFESAPFVGAVGMLDTAQGRLRPTRGAAAAMIDLDLPAGMATFSGIGNISGYLMSEGKTQGLCSRPGILGADSPRFQEFFYAWRNTGLLVMHSDGIQTRWRLENFPGLLARHPAIVAALLYRDFRRGRDDATVLVARLAPPVAQA